MHRVLPKIWLSILFLPFYLHAEGVDPDSLWISENYEKSEFNIPMRDRVNLYTAVYAPKDKTVDYPILLLRTPYSCSPYGTENFRKRLGPNMKFAKEKYIFVFQDVRGRFMSQGEFVNVRPHNPAKRRGGKKPDIDESSDTYDTIDWLLKNVKGNNSRVGIWGISYPGFYTAAGIIDNHPAVKAASPQAPVSDWFIGDDFHHNGATFLPHAFNFMTVFGQPRHGLTKKWGTRFNHGTVDGYQFFLDMGPLKNANEKYMHDTIAFWNEVMQHPNYDEWWQSRNINANLKNISCPVMTVGGWFDAENCYGALNVYKNIEKNNPETFNILIEGPWVHGGWNRTEGDKLGDIDFDQKTSAYFQENVELIFFNYFLKGKGSMDLPEALCFATGSNEWHSFDEWPPKNVEPLALWFHPNEKLSFVAPEKGDKELYDEYISDPANPVPFMTSIQIGMPREYMVADQRHAATRPDVLVYKTDPLENNITISGPITVSLNASTTGTDCDFVVKLIDVYPNDSPDNSVGVKMGGYQMLLRGEPFRARFRNSFESPEAMVPEKIEHIEFTMPDVLHTFKKGHRIMVQVQSSWFPLADINPQQFVDINQCDESAFQKATQRVFYSAHNPSYLKVSVLK